MSVPNTPSHSGYDLLGNAALRLSQLMMEPHPGLATWQGAVSSALYDIRQYSQSETVTSAMPSRERLREQIKRDPDIESSTGTPPSDKPQGLAGKKG